MVPITDAAAVIGTRVRNLKRAAIRKEIPCLRFGTQWFVPEAWLTSVTSWPSETTEVAS